MLSSSPSLTLNSAPRLDRYAIAGDADEWAAAQAKVASRIGGAGDGAIPSVLSIKNPASTKALKRKSGEEQKEGGKDKKDKKDKKRRKEKH